jgi:transcriptional regulator of aromatic amino acid metabolism
MKLVCSKCNKNYRDDYSELSSERVITRGICDECTSFLLWPNRPTMTDFLDCFDAPIVAIDSLGNVITANQIARELLQKELSDIVGLQGGNVFECAFAKLPEGCGKTIHCDGCTIRKTVMDTLHTGKSHSKMPAGLTHGTSVDCVEMQLLISTERVNEIVMLQIESIL